MDQTGASWNPNLRLAEPNRHGTTARATARGHALRITSREHEGASLRCGGRRLAVRAFDPKRRAIVLCGGDKSGGSQRRFYRNLIDTADKRFDAHLKAMKESGQPAGAPKARKRRR